MHQFRSFIIMMQKLPALLHAIPKWSFGLSITSHFLILNKMVIYIHFVRTTRTIHLKGWKMKISPQSHVRENSIKLYQAR